MLSNTLRFATVLACSLLSFSPAAIGQDVAGLPACATTCLASSLASSGKTCAQESNFVNPFSAQTDFACLCKNNDFIKANNDCYQKTCSVGDLKTAAGWGAKTCAAAGVQIAANGVNSAADGVNSAANSATTGLTGGNHTNSTTTPATIPATTATNNSTSSANSSPVNTNPTPVRPSSAAAVSVETVKFFAIGSALVCSMWMI
ncbi:hypothetical protein PSHT_03825 [Puccinia striiformis]|uniref:CFEM domain-containing protein n=1 Tax=Puccinia striiformis TaxID=27350 RepID=A0A2S4WEF1_9BASI|nr:hypothetical protein PSHT_03825 [Puccinia striiformis]